ncbi:MAG: hypothetical protein EA358_01760 [Flavobacteriales bacterium]|nr:MAG: hypothetical protein EA358_01760 [Flavobacteriales bacterium]
MGQLLLPLFPADTTMITPVLGVENRDGVVYYLLSGMPIYSHKEGDMVKFRFITSHMILHGLCKNRDIVKTFHVSDTSVQRYKKNYPSKVRPPFLGENFEAVRAISCFRMYWIAFKKN